MESNTIPVLQTEPTRGLTEAQARQRQAAGLRNTPPPDLTKSTARILRDNLLTFYNLLFLALAGCLVAVGAVQETLFLGIVVCNAAVGVVQELRVRAALRRIALLAARPVRTVRDGTEQLLDTADLVRDDIVRLRPGDQVPADAILVEGRAECNESLVTGEEDPVLHTPGQIQIAVGVFYPGLQRHPGDGGGVVAGEYPQRHPLGAEVGQGLGGAGAQLVPQHHKSQRAQTGGQRRAAVRQAAALGQYQYPAPLSQPGCQLRLPGSAIRPQHQFRRAQDQAAPVRQKRRPPFAGRGKRHLPL